MPPDQALNDVDALLDNFMIGNEFVKKEFDVRPRVAWQLDDFGVSAGFTRLAEDLGIDMLIYQSASPEEQEQMADHKSFAQVWRTSERNFGNRKDVLGVQINNQNGYCWPSGFWSDSNYLVDTPMNLRKGSSGYDFDQRVMALYADAVSKFNSARETQIMQPFGCDMAYMDASVNYLILDELMYVWQELGLANDIQLVYSTPTQFHDDLRKDNQHISEDGGW